jgi:predicted enzyme related to lactoylglutathione lyase
MAALGLGTCREVQADAFEVPALANPATGLHLVGKLVWLDLETTDLPGAKRFYHALFGWQYRDYHAYGVSYTVAMANGNAVAGLVPRPVMNETEHRSAWLPFFSVADLDASFSKALANHAEVRSEPEDLPLRGRQARLRDPEGVVFGLLASSSGDPADDPNPRAFGTWGVPTLLARDPGGEAVFYQTLFDFAVQGEPTDQGFERIRLSAAHVDRATVRPLPGGDQALAPQWVGFVRVFSAATTAQQAVKLGARILVADRPAAHGAIMTILADPSGATFGVLELPPSSVSLTSR